MPSPLLPPDVIDLDAARARNTAAPGAVPRIWSCAECELDAGPFAPAEAGHLARLHDLIQHRGSPTAVVTEPRPELIAS